MKKSIEQNDFNIANLKYDESQENTDENKIEYKDSPGWKQLEKEYNEGDEANKEKVLNFMEIFISQMRDEVRNKIYTEIGEIDGVIADETIPKEIYGGIASSEDHKSRILINLFIDNGDYKKAKQYIEGTIKDSSYQGRVRKLEGILESQGLNYHEL